MPAPLAPAWHTRALLTLLLAVPLAGLIAPPSHEPSAASPMLHVYLPSILVSGGLAAYVTTVGLPRGTLRALFGRTWSAPRRAIADVECAILVTVVIVAVDALLARALAAPESIHARAALPTTAAERAAWLAFSFAAGVGEELVYRGYLLQQVARSSGSLGIGLVLQALLFGIAHAEQGGAVVARFALHGAMLGALALWRNSLLSGVLAHVAINVYAGASG